TAEVIGRMPESRAARLNGYARYRIRGLWYPGIVPAENMYVDGCLFSGLDQGDLAVLDRYESDRYVRNSVMADLDGRATPCFAYVIRPDCTRELSTESWNLAAFLNGAYGPPNGS
ncbi:MAG: gamma-glutamylcyclotransferase family protein, partial [Verrucomicrobiota bacterium]